MAFFPRSFYQNHHHNHHRGNAADGSFTPLFRLLDDFDSYSRQGGDSSGSRRLGAAAWQPKFDIRETADAYELHGELAGLSKDNVHIEFTDPQTMQVRGKVERTYTAGTPPAGLVENSSSAKGGALTEGQEQEQSQEQSQDSSSAHRATAEDEVEGESSDAKQVESRAGESQQGSSSSSSSAGRPAVDQAKYWLTERSIGEFARTFSFPTRVEQDGVSASLNDGILAVTVPKAKKHESRRIAVN